MKYKLLVENGFQFLCLEDGTRLPFQTETVVKQRVKKPATVTVTAWADKRVGSDDDSRLEYNFEDNTLSLIDYKNNREVFLDKIENLSVSRMGEWGLLVVEFMVHCEICDTVDKPVNLNEVLIGANVTIVET